MNFNYVIYASACLLPLVALAQEKSLGVVTVSSGQPTSLPTQIPTTMEGRHHQGANRKDDQRHRQRRRFALLPQLVGAQALYR